jgi:hypothetical protein
VTTASVDNLPASGKQDLVRVLSGLKARFYDLEHDILEAAATLPNVQADLLRDWMSTNLRRLSEQIKP